MSKTELDFLCKTISSVSSRPHVPCHLNQKREPWRVDPCVLTNFPENQKGSSYAHALIKSFTDRKDM